MSLKFLTFYGITTKDAECEDGFKILNRSIVYTFWDGEFFAHILDGSHLCEYEGGVASYKTLTSL